MELRLNTEFRAGSENKLGVEEHLRKCRSCSEESATLDRLINLLNTTDCPRYTTSEWSAIHQNITAAIASIPQTNARKIISRFPGVYSINHAPLKALAALVIISIMSLSAFRLFNKSVSYPKIVAISGSAYSNISDNAASRILARNNRMLPPGRSIETDSDASVEIMVDKGSSIHVGRNSRLSVSDFAAKRTILALKNGDILAQVSKRTPDQLFRIETPNAYCEVIGTRFNVTTQRDNFRNRYITTLVVQEGTVQFGSGMHNLPVKAGNAVAIFGDSIGTPTSTEDPLIKLLQQRPGYGRYTVSSNPREAQVSIDGIPCGVTPFHGYLPYGNHNVNCSKNGFLLWSGTLQIDAHRQSMLEIALTPGTPETQQNPVLLAGTDTFNNSTFRSAVARINAGDYRNALVHLGNIIGNRSSEPHLLAAALSKASMCYKHTGNYIDAALMLGRIIDGKFSAEQRGNALFERATIYQSMLHDVPKAISDFKQYVNEFGNGLWVEEATISFADLLYSTANFKDAAIQYQAYCDNFTKNTTRERALYRLAIIYSNNLNDPKRAFSVFNRLLLEFPAGSYAEDALFRSADCLFRQGKTSSALAEFASYIRRYPAGKWHSEVSTRLKRFETAGVK